MSADAPHRNINPYIAGSPVSGAVMFFGRDDVFAFIRRNLIGRHANHPLVLYGQRRTGKTSVLHQLHRHLDAEYWCVLIDLQGLHPDGLGSLMQGIAAVISRELRRNHQVTVEVPEKAVFLADPAAAFERTFLDQVWIAIGDHQLVLMLDEVIRLDEEVQAGRLDRGVFDYLRHLMQHHERLNFVFSLGSGIEEMSRDYAFLFSGSLYHRISFLEPSAARDLITRPARGHYDLTDQAIGRILQITSGHPYYTQLVCHCIFDAWAHSPTPVIEASGVDDVLSAAIELGSANLTYIWLDSSPAERAVMAGIAIAMRGVGTAVTADEIHEIWASAGVDVPTREITQALRGLTRREVIAGSSTYSFTVDLQRLWLDKHRHIEWVKEDLADAIAQWKSSASRPSGRSEHSPAEVGDPKRTEAPPSAESSISAGNLAAFCEQLRDLQRQAGMPTLVQLRAQMEPAPGISTLSALLRGKIRRAPRWELVSGLVTACVSHAASNGIQLDGPEADLMTWRRRHEELLDPMDASRAPQYRAFPDWGGRPSAIAGLPHGKLYQPVLFVGLGGTGCNVGIELERALRDQICGPDGREFTAKPGKEDMLPYQLPSCIQFVYADLDLAELKRLPGCVVSGPEHLPAVPYTAQYTAELVPKEPGYPELARQLRLRAGDLVKGWLPPRTKDEPKVTPLHRGAGQFPTIGRAVLFSTLLDGTLPTVREIENAVGRLAGSGADLYAMGGRLPRGVDVFVAFSVAGGTGAGIFYDYLHLIASAVERNGLRVQIHPLALMPSAFEESLGGGRSAELNAGRALLDLFRLVDQQNRAQTRRILRASADSVTHDEDELAITYPGHERIFIGPGRIQTAFLFPRPAGASRQDMYLSMASLITSLIGTETSSEEQRLGNQPVSFAESFVNDEVLVADSFVNDSEVRAAAADDGIGRQGVSTALIASLTTPVDQMAEIVADRLFSEAIREMSVPARAESNLQIIREFLVKAGADPVVKQQVGPYAETQAAQGARNVTAALNDRLEAMRAGIKSFRIRLNLEVPQLAADFHPSRAVVELLGRYDPFRIARVVVGHQDLVDPVEQGGAEGLLSSRRTAPAAPPGTDTGPSAIPRLRDRLTRKVRWNDQQVVDTRNQQDEWYEWQARATWAEFWDLHAPRWQRPLEQASRELSEFTSVLNAFADQGPGDFAARSAQLYRKRVGVSYLLPAGSGGMGEFYENVVRRLRIHQAQRGLVGTGAPTSELLSTLLDEGTWPATFELSLEDSPERAVAYLREKVRTAIRTFLREEPYGGQRILPRLRDLLAQAAEQGRSGAGEAPIFGEYLRGLAGVLGVMLPADGPFLGTGQFRALVSYPAEQKSVVVEQYLRSAINLPSGLSAMDYRSTVTEEITVLLYRTGMSITQVPEVRNTAQRWMAAVSSAEPRDLLRWRQRTGYNFGYLATAEENAAILHRLLCALWNGKAAVTGPKESPEQLTLALSGGLNMTLRLDPLFNASSWGSLLHAYEWWALDGDLMHRELCKELMLELPVQLMSTPPPPADLYQVLRKLTVQQVTLLDEMTDIQPADQLANAAQMRDFWTVILSAALDLEFTGVPSPHRRNLRELERAVGFTID